MPEASVSSVPSWAPTALATHQPTGDIYTDDGNTSPWVTNSFAYVNPIPIPGTVGSAYTNFTTLQILCWVNVAVAGLVLIHSFLLHGFKYNSVRTQTDVAAVASIGSAVVVQLALKRPTRLMWAVLFDFLYNGVLIGVVQLCDSYMFYYRLMAITKLSLTHRFLIQLYIWVLLIVPWLPSQTIIPFFYNTNEVLYGYYSGVLLNLVTAATIVYNFYFTFRFMAILRALLWKPNVSPTTGMATTSVSPLGLLMNNNIVKVVAAKSIGHCITSSLAAFCETPAFPPGINNQCFNLIIVVGMHFWVNYTNNNYAFFKSEAQVRGRPSPGCLSLHHRCKIAHQPCLPYFHF